MTAAPSMAEVLLRHGHAEWTEFDAQVVAQALAAAGFGHVASVEERWREVTGDPTPEHAAATNADLAASMKALAAERDEIFGKAIKFKRRNIENARRAQAAEAQVEAMRALADEWATEGADLIRNCYSGRDVFEGEALQGCADALRAALDDGATP